MPDYRATETDLLNRGFNALADATRRDIIARLSEGEASVTDLAAGYDMALPSLLQHVRVLEAAGLISTMKTGRVRTCRLETLRLAELDRWITHYHSVWQRRLDRLGDLLNNKGDTQ
ncbi:ArsR/SmtB family transcription factor [Hyphomonas sp.]|jgi:DNA-binding transcriptional ArsR family regulator|uniref:ArsR/SmtB family transcription factor n=1 Tax=Hyphomonas sp. TaxID=87 RepID=UPI0037BF5836